MKTCLGIYTVWLLLAFLSDTGLGIPKEILREIKEFKRMFRYFFDYNSVWDRLKVCKFGGKADMDCNDYCWTHSLPNLWPYCGGVCTGLAAELCTCVYCPVYLPQPPRFNGTALGH